MSQKSSLVRSPRNTVAQLYLLSQITAASRDKDRAGTHCWSPDPMHEPFFPEGKLSRQQSHPLNCYQGYSYQTTPTRDSPGTTAVRQRLSHQVPCMGSWPRTIHFSLIQFPALMVITGMCNCRKPVVPKPPLKPRICIQLPFLRS